MSWKYLKRKSFDGIDGLDGFLQEFPYLQSLALIVVGLYGPRFGAGVML